jgi:hypothetical protein
MGFDHHEARPMPVHAVSAVRLDVDGRVIAVEWAPVDTTANRWEREPEPANVAEVVDALESGDHVFSLFPSDAGLVPGRPFMVVEYDNGWKTINLDGDSTLDREVHDMQRMPDKVPAHTEGEPA